MLNYVLHFICIIECGYVTGGLNPVLPRHLFKQYVVPQLIKMFHVREIHVRLLLLSHFSAYVDLFPKTVLRQFILPQVG